MERLAAATVPRVAHRALATLPAARPPPAAVATNSDPSFRARGRFFAGRPTRATHARWTATPEAIRRGDRRLVATPRAIVETETSEAETAVDDEAVPDASADGLPAPADEETPVDGSVRRARAAKKSTLDEDGLGARPIAEVATKSANPLTEALDGLVDVVATATTKIRGTANRLQAKTRAATHPPLPVVSTFDELLRFARIASLNSAPQSEIEAFFAETDERVVILDMVSVKQRLFIATDHERKRHTISFRGTTNLTNVVQNIRLSNNPVTASGRLASVGRSLSGAFSGLKVSGRRASARTKTTDDGDGDADVVAGSDPSSSSDSDSGSFDEDDETSETSDAEACADIDWSSATPESLARLGCTDHLPMHRGYRIVARECADALAPLMTPGYSAQLTGHSLGGAVAVATALLFRSRGVAVSKVVTFGAPKLGPRETRDAAEPLDILRVVQKDDLIPLLPMSRPFVRKPYVHLGEGVVLDNDAPGRYARLSKEWGTAGILWKQRRHTGYARGESEAARAARARASDASRGVPASPPSAPRDASASASASAFVSADEPDEALSASDERERRGRFRAARERLRRLRAALGEGIARRRAAFAAASGAVAQAEGPGSGFRAPAGAPAGAAAADSGHARDARDETAAGEVSVSSDESARAFAREVAAWASSNAEASEGERRPSSVSAFSDSDGAAEGRRKSSGSSRWSFFDARRLSARSADPAPFDDVEGELFVRVAETTPFGGATDVAAAAADEWERAAAATESGEAEGDAPPLFPRKRRADDASLGVKERESVAGGLAAGTYRAPPPSDRDSGGTDRTAAKTWLVDAAPAPSSSSPSPASSRDAGADHRAGPTIFEELWKLRGLDAETRGNRLESHRMRRYVEEIQRAIDAGPVQTSLAGVYAGKEGDEVGLDFSGDAFSEADEDGAVEGGVASWMTWSR